MSAAKDPKDAVSAVTTTNARNADAGPKDAVSAATTTNAKSAAEAVDAAVDVEAMTTKSADAGPKAVANAVTTMSVDGLMAVDALMVVSADAPRVKVEAPAKSVKAGADPKAEVVKAVNVAKAAAARASTGKRS